MTLAFSSDPTSTGRLQHVLFIASMDLPLQSTLCSVGLYRECMKLPVFPQQRQPCSFYLAQALVLEDPSKMWRLDANGITDSDILHNCDNERPATCARILNSCHLQAQTIRSLFNDHLTRIYSRGEQPRHCSKLAPTAIVSLSQSSRIAEGIRQRRVRILR